jgi:hypothetical protein
MEKGRRTITGRCGLWAAFALLCFAGCLLLASLPKLPESLRVALAFAGYVSFVLLLGCALRAWRDDWSELWFLPTGRASGRGTSRARKAAPVDTRRPRTLAFRP